MKKLVPDVLWELIAPLLPKHPNHPHGGRPPVDDRVALTGIIFVLRTGIPWKDLPQELGCSGMTCWRRLRHWNEAGVWLRLHQVLLQQLEDAGRIDWSHAVVDSSSVRAMRRGPKTGKNPTDRAKYGTKRHLMTDAHGMILSARVTAANRNDVTEAENLVTERPRVRRRRSRRTAKPKAVAGDRGYDSEAYRRFLKRRGIRPMIARRAKPGGTTIHGSGLGVIRWVVESAHALTNKFKRLRIRDDIKAEVYEAFLLLAVGLINLKHL